MKKAISILFVMALMAVTNVQAQGIYFGFKGGLNNTKLNTDLENVNTKSGYGWFIGPTLKVNILPFLGVQAAALYSQTSSKINDERIKQKSVLVPLHLRLNLQIGAESGLFLATGPQFAFNVGDDEFSWKDTSTYNTTFQLRKSNFSWNFGVGVTLIKNVELSFDYSLGLAKTGDLEHLSKDDKPKSKMWAAGLTWLF